MCAVRCIVWLHNGHSHDDDDDDGARIVVSEAFSKILITSLIYHGFLKSEMSICVFIMSTEKKEEKYRQHGKSTTTTTIGKKMFRFYVCHHHH